MEQKLVDDLVLAFVMCCDADNLTYEQGLEAARDMADRLPHAAEDRKSYAA